jgi:hypothetical protein
MEVQDELVKKFIKQKSNQLKLEIEITRLRIEENTFKPLKSINTMRNIIRLIDLIEENEFEKKNTNEEEIDLLKVDYNIENKRLRRENTINYLKNKLKERINEIEEETKSKDNIRLIRKSLNTFLTINDRSECSRCRIVKQNKEFYELVYFFNAGICIDCKNLEEQNEQE